MMFGGASGRRLGFQPAGSGCKLHYIPGVKASRQEVDHCDRAHEPQTLEFNRRAAKEPYKS